MNKTLLPPSATARERAIESVTARIAEVPVPLGALWNPDTCPAALLPWLAWALSVDNWDSRWDELVKRDVIRQSVMVHRTKGTRGALERALGALGVRIEVAEWFQTGGAAHTFTLTALANAALASGNEEVLGRDFGAMVRRVVDAVKPVRSHYDLRVGASFDTGIQVGTGLFGGSFLRDRATATVRPIVRRSAHALVSLGRGASVTRLTMEVK